MKPYRRLVAALAVVLVSTAASVGVVVSPAEAAACARGTGVSVVVDFHQLGGGVSTTCVAGGGGTSAASLFRAAGVAMTPVSSQPGAICRVQGKPASDPCTRMPQADAYWALWWSRGDGTWTYATDGVTSLTVPRGGWVAWSWNGQEGRAQPGVTPLGPSPAPRATASSGTGTAERSTGTRGPSSSGTAARPSASPRPSASAMATPPTKKHQKEQAGAQASARASQQAATSEDTETTSAQSDGGTDPGSGAPVWILVAVLAVLAGSGGVVAWRRRAAAER